MMDSFCLGVIARSGHYFGTSAAKRGFGQETAPDQRS